MSDETPRKPFDETPAPEREPGESVSRDHPHGTGGYGDPPRYEHAPPPPPPEGQAPPQLPGSTWQGVRALLLILAGMAVLELVLYLWSKAVDGPRYEASFNSAQSVVWLAGGIASIVAIVRLPARSRTGFLASCAIFVGAAFTLLMVMCGIALLNM